MPSPLRYLSALLTVLVFAGCSTPTSSPASAGPAPAIAAAPAIAPAPAADLTPATIRGSEETSTLLDNFTAFITALDDQPIGNGRKGWNQPITFVPGKRRFAVEFIRGTFYARTELVLDAKPGAAYELRHASDAQVYGEHTYCEFWIVDLATGEKVTPVRRTGLGKLTPGG
jgi:hypothetical protein